MVIIFDNSVFPLKHYVKRFLNAFWGTKSYLWVAKLEESMTNLCPETCLNGTAQSVDAQDNHYDTLLLSCSVTQTL